MESKTSEVESNEIRYRESFVNGFLDPIFTGYQLAEKMNHTFPMDHNVQPTSPISTSGDDDPDDRDKFVILDCGDSLEDAF